MSQTKPETILVVVESVVPLPETEKKELQAIIEKQLGPINLDEKINPALIGGLKISIGDKIVDNSIRTRLNLINKDLLQHAKK